ncbi:hypothetical protein [Klebsiella huaxiensis]|uniref:Uncharacterized protein n=1 Tax=Klebsiella huaxiensis TaxID=2153354 RepID=A0ABT6EBC9_9ENTR|nr:hypothetical protein [Klebsiella huaxiensis]MDG1642470.1 hypothetical protein [Klebsiella huaxiensis]
MNDFIFASYYPHCIADYFVMSVTERLFLLCGTFFFFILRAGLRYKDVASGL